MARLHNPLISLTLLAACASGEQSTSTAATTTTTTSPTTDPSTGESETDGTETTDIGTGSDSDTTAGPTDSDTTSDSDSDSDSDPSSGNPTTGPDCIDMDSDGYGEDCELGPDCDDSDPNNHTDEGCANCIDNDQDSFWIECDIYDDVKPGPDCDDSNVSVGSSDDVELCNGIAENCAGEIDPLPADEMCPSGGGEAPNVAPENGWICNVMQLGVDGCEIANCNEGFFDSNHVPADGCECVGTSRDNSLADCSELPQGYLGVVAEGQQLSPISGVIPELDNGIGNGAEDWYSVEFTETEASGSRPNTGVIKVWFSQNSGDTDNPDYRFEVFRSCTGAPFEQGLATVHSSGIEPPALEWWFFDDHNFGSPTTNVEWPDLVFIRVFRVNHPDICSPYELMVEREAN